MTRLGLASLVLAACSTSALPIHAVLDGAVTPDLAAPPDLGAAADLAATPDLVVSSVGSVACPAPDAPCVLSGDNVCCVSQTGHASCVRGSCGANDYSYACDGPEDCPGALCCFDLNTQRGSSCRSDCGMSYRLCHHHGECPFGQNCYQLEWSTPSLFACFAL